MGVPGSLQKTWYELYDVMQTSLDLASTASDHTHSHEASCRSSLTGLPGDPHRAAFAEGGYNVYEPQCFEPLEIVRGSYLGKIRLENERPQTVSRCAIIRTRTHKLVRRPQDQSELYELHNDPQEQANLFGDSSFRAVQQGLETQLLDHFVNTTGIAPMDKDSRLCSPFYPTRTDLPPSGWHQGHSRSRANVLVLHSTNGDSASDFSLSAQRKFKSLAPCVGWPLFIDSIGENHRLRLV